MATLKNKININEKKFTGIAAAEKTYTKNC